MGACGRRGEDVTSHLHKYQKIGKLTLICKDDSYHWLVQCDCGRTELATTKRLNENLRLGRGCCASCRAKHGPEFLQLGVWSADTDRHEEFVLNLMAACDPWRTMMKPYIRPGADHSNIPSATPGPKTIGGLYETGSLVPENSGCDPDDGVDFQKDHVENEDR